VERLGGRGARGGTGRRTSSSSVALDSRRDDQRSDAARDSGLRPEGVRLGGLSLVPRARAKSATSASEAERRR